MNSIDEVVQATLLGPDDHLYRKEQQRKRAPKVATPALPDAPCCARCINWQELDEGREPAYGECAWLFLVRKGPKRDVIVSGEELRRFDPQPETEPLRTTGYFLACDGFFAKAVAA